MFSTDGGASLGIITTNSVSGRGFTPEEVAEQALSKIIHVGSKAHPLIREQAEAYKNEIREVLVATMRQVVRSHNTTLSNRFRAAGHLELIKLLEN
jgi:hypothetical protein